MSFYKTKKSIKKIIYILLIVCILLIATYIIMNVENYISNKSNIENDPVLKVDESVLYNKKDELDTLINNNDNNDGNIYYVSKTGTSTDGTDINNPLSLELANEKNFNAGDKILFKCDDVFYGKFNPQVTKEEGKYLIVSSYGNGNKPIISGASILINSNAWEKYDDGIYRLNLSDRQNFIRQCWI